MYVMDILKIEIYLTNGFFYSNTQQHMFHDVWLGDLFIVMCPKFVVPVTEKECKASEQTQKKNIKFITNIASLTLFE